MSYFARGYDAHHKIERAFKSFGADHPTEVIRTENDPRWRQSETDPGLRAVRKNGPAALEPCRRSEWLLHGPDPSVGPTEYKVAARCSARHDGLPSGRLLFSYPSYGG